MNNHSIPSMQQPYNHDSFSKILRPSTALQSQLFLRKYRELSMQVEIVNNHSIPSMNIEKQITNLSVKHSFTLYPSLSPYWQTESRTEKQIHLLRVGWRNFFPVVLLCQCLVLVGNWFWFYILMYLEYNTVVVLC